jgi:hypothetical protein
MSDARETMHRLYGNPVDPDLVWADRDALHAAERSMTSGVARQVNRVRVRRLIAEKRRAEYRRQFDKESG